MAAEIIDTVYDSIKNENNQDSLVNNKVIINNNDIMNDDKLLKNSIKTNNENSE